MPEAYRVHLRIERLENHQYLATSETVPGLVAQGRTVTETVEIAQDVARKLIESCLEHGDPVPEGLRAIDAEPLDAYDDLITAFCASRAVSDASFWLLVTLKESRRRLPGATCMVCEALLRRARDEWADGLDLHTVAELVFGCTDSIRTTHGPLGCWTCSTFFVCKG